MNKVLRFWKDEASGLEFAIVEVNGLPLRVPPEMVPWYLTQK